MKNKYYVFPKILSFIFLTALFLVPKDLFSQCPVPKNVDIAVVKCASNFPTVSELNVSGTEPSSVVEWFLSNAGGTSLNSNLLLESRTYWVQQTIGACVSNRVSTVVTIFSPTVPVVAAEQKFCYTTVPTVANLSPSGNGILWYESDYDGTQNLGTPLTNSTELIDGKTYYASQFNFPCESLVRSASTVRLERAPNAGLSTSFAECEINLVNTNLFTLLGTADNGGSWTGPNGQPHSGVFIAGTDVSGDYTYTVLPVSVVCLPVSATVSVTIIIIQPPTTSNINQTFCESQNATIDNLSVVGSSVKWYDAEFGGNLIAPGTPLSDGIYWASQTVGTDSCESTLRLPITVTIIKPVPPTTSNQNQAFCKSLNATIDNLFVSGTNVKWYDAEFGGNLIAPGSILVNGTYWASQTESGNGCESKNRLAITITILEQVPPTTSNQNQTFCEILKATFSDISISGTSIKWYDAATGGNLILPSTLLANGTYWAAQTDALGGCESTVRLSISVTITKPLPPTTTNQNQSFCELQNATINNLSVVGSFVKWYDAENGGNLLVPSTILSNGTYWVSQTEGSNGCESTIRLAITVTIIKPVPPTTSNQNQAFCKSLNATIDNLNVTGSNIKWYDAPTGGNLIVSGTLLTDRTYWATQTEVTSGCESVSRLSVIVSIIKPLPPTTSNQNQSYCEILKATFNDISITGTAIKWFDAPTGGNLISGNTLLTDGTYWASQTENSLSCESTNRLSFTISIIKQAPPTTSVQNQTYCELQNATVNNLSIMGSNIKWYNAETGGNLILSGTLLNNGTYWASQTETISGCESISRLAIQVSIIKPVPPTTTSQNQTYCKINNATIADLAIMGTNIKWYDAAVGGNLISSSTLLTNRTYWASQTEISLGCESLNRIAINVTISDPVIPTSSNLTPSYCLVDKPTIADIVIQTSSSAYSIAWYNSLVATNALPLITPLTNGIYYAAEVGVTGCESTNRLAITVTVNDVLPVTIANANQRFCLSNAPTIANISAQGNGIIWYATQTDNTPLQTSTLLMNNEDYWAIQKDPITGCVSAIRTPVNIIITDPATPNLIALGNEFCKIIEPTIANLNANVSGLTGGTISWFNSYPNGSQLNLSEPLTEGGTYYAIETDVNGCKSKTALEVTVTLESCNKYDIEIYDGFSPTGNGVNDTFNIGNLKDLYPNYKVEFYNRWGNLVYITNASKPNWNGRLNGDGELVPAGVYYFIIYFNKDNREPLQRRLYLSR